LQDILCSELLLKILDRKNSKMENRDVIRIVVVRKQFISSTLFIRIFAELKITNFKLKNFKFLAWL